MVDAIFAALGFLGAIVVLIAYFQVARKSWHSDSHLFHIGNAVGAGLLAVYSLQIRSFPNFLLNAIWAAVGIVALFRIHGPTS